MYLPPHAFAKNHISLNTLDTPTTPDWPRRMGAEPVLKIQISDLEKFWDVMKMGFWGDIVRLELIDLDPSILEGLIDALCALHLD